jgi:hypothetical protein
MLRACLLGSLVVLGGCGSEDDGEPVVPGAEGEGEVGDDDDADGVGGCDCPAGTTCGTANGVDVCRTTSGVPLFSHVFLIVMENTSYETLAGSDRTPYLHGLAEDWATSSDYHGIDHPSLSNYLAMTAGTTFGVSCDCQPVGGDCNALSCNALVGTCGCGQAAENVADQIEAAGLGWRAYGEGMGDACNVEKHGDYAPKHVPFLYYDSVRGDGDRCAAHVVDYGAFAGDLAAGPASFVFIAPNLVNDMHDPILAGEQNREHGDAWLAEHLPRILESDAFADGGVVIIAWDEDDLSGVLAPDDPIPLFVLSPYAQRGYVSDVHADHYSLLATIEDGLGLPRLGNAADATPLADLFVDR